MYEGVEADIQLLAFLSSSVNELWASSSGRFTMEEIIPVPVLWEARWAAELVVMLQQVEKSCRGRNRTPVVRPVD
jgi:hypothetical protein